MSSARGDSLPLLSHFGRKSVAVIVVTCALALSHKATLARAKKQITHFGRVHGEGKTKRPTERKSVRFGDTRCLPHTN